MKIGADRQQIMIDFSSIIKKQGDNGRNAPRPKLRADQAVPPEQVQAINTVRELCGFTMKDVGERAGLDQFFACRVFSGRQRVRPEEFRMLKNALADLVFEKILQAGGR